YRHIAGSGTKVKNAGVIAPEDVSKSPGCATPPQTVNVHGQDVVGEIIAGSDLVKHSLDSLCSGTLVGYSRRFGAGDASRRRAGVSFCRINHENGCAPQRREQLQPGPYW